MQAMSKSGLDSLALIGAARSAVEAATDAHLAPAMAEVNKSRQFDSKGRCDALQLWLARQASHDAGFDPVNFVLTYLAEHPGDVTAMVVLALQFKTLEDRKKAVEMISAAVTAARYDLHVGNVARLIFAWANETHDDEVDEWLKGRHCNLPFTNFDTMPSGEVFVCCGDWLPVPIGNIHTQTAEEIWNSPVANEIRASILDGSFRYCSRRSCMAIVNRTLPAALTSPPAPAPPSRVVLSHDNSCNLSCPSCRTGLILAKKQEEDKLNSLLETVFVPLLRGAKTVRISGSGDPFASRHYRKLLVRLNRRDFPHLRVDLHTNAQLFDQRAWDELELTGKIENVEISIDAATAKTYHVVRRGGDFERLLENLEFIRELRRLGAFRELLFSFVVQQRNYREMPAFVLLGDRFGADYIDFRMILNWGVASAEEFNQNFIGNPNHPEYEEYLKTLCHPQLQRAHVRVPSPPSAGLGSGVAGFFGANWAERQGWISLARLRSRLSSRADS
jgi:hypothetical protein